MHNTVEGMILSSERLPFRSFGRGIFGSLTKPRSPCDMRFASVMEVEKSHNPNLKKPKCGALECGVNKNSVVGSPRLPKCSGEISMLPTRRNGRKSNSIALMTWSWLWLPADLPAAMLGDVSSRLKQGARPGRHLYPGTIISFK